MCHILEGEVRLTDAAAKPIPLALVTALSEEKYSLAQTKALYLAAIDIAWLFRIELYDPTPY